MRWDSIRAAAVPCALIFSAAAPAQGEEAAVTVTGQVRVRSEVDMRDFRSESATKQYTDLRTRVGVQAVVDGNATAFIQFQDSRRLGGRTVSGADASGLLNDGKNVDVHQAFLKVARLWENGVGVQAGRFEVNLGNERVFGSVGWHNVGRSWEGVATWLARDDVKAAGYWLKRREADDPFENRDFDLFGVTAGIPSVNLDLFAFLEHDAAAAPGDSGNALDRASIGLYYRRTSGAFDVNTNFVYQAGDLAGTDIGAFLATAEVGYTFPGAGKARVAAGFDYASGDDDPADDTYAAYDNLYYTGHKFRGYMDYFLASRPEGLVDLMLRGSMVPAPGWAVEADVHLFRAATEYVDFEGEETSAVGAEVDLTASTSRIAGVGLAGGASLFLPSESFAGFADPDPGLWFYAMLTAEFGGKQP